MNRSAKELGAIVRARRLALGLKQREVVDAAGVSEPTYRAIENGRTEAGDLTLAAVSRGLEWPSEALGRIKAGEDPEGFDSADFFDEPSIRLSASGVDLDELRELDPEGYQTVLAQIDLLVRRARKQRDGD